jgi:WD domain, G-beta repeat
MDEFHRVVGIPQDLTGGIGARLAISNQDLGRPRERIPADREPSRPGAAQSSARGLQTSVYEYRAKTPEIIAVALTIAGAYPHQSGPVGHRSVRCLAYSPDSRTLALADQRSEAVRLRDLAAGAGRAALSSAEGAVLALAISPEGRTLAAADYHGAVHFWGLATGRLQWPRLEHPGVQTLAFAPDGRLLATGGFDGTIHLWDWPRAEEDD